MTQYVNKEGLHQAQERRRRGPTRREIDLDVLYDHASIGMSQRQISDWFGIDIQLFQANKDWVDIWYEGNSNFQQTILDKQYNIATNDNHKDQHKMLIHLGKVLLGQKETQNVEATVSTSFEQLMDLVKK